MVHNMMVEGMVEGPLQKNWIVPIDEQRGKVVIVNWYEISLEVGFCYK